MIAQCFKRSDLATPNTPSYNLYVYHKDIFGMADIMYFTAIPYFATFVFNILINKVIK